MSWWSYIFLLFAIVALIATIIWLLIVWLKEKGVPADDCLIINFCSHLDGSGRFLLSEKTVDSTSYNDREIITGVPRDVDWKKLEKSKKKLEDVKIIVESNKVISIPKGASSPSKDKNIKILLTPTPEDIPEGIKNTVLGKLLGEITENKNVQKDILSIVREGSSLKTQYLTKLGDGEISIELVNEYELVLKHIKELIEKKQPAFGSSEGK